MIVKNVEMMRFYNHPSIQQSINTCRQ